MTITDIPSPDIWDAISFCFLEDVHYMTLERSVGGGAGQSLLDLAGEVL